MASDDVMELTQSEIARLSQLKAQFEQAQLQLVAAQQAVDLVRLQYRVAELETLAAHSLPYDRYRVEPTSSGFAVVEKRDGGTA